ncbi:MAG: hypothetical protein DWI20_00460 [Planctomycetota bacterium]|nr:MAG: hypothetical protein DWI20_00460 [Planctomycetota bacterium]
MPTYEYICNACGHEFDEFQSIKADRLEVCPKCRKKKLERKIGIGGAVIFKGGGFYETDYRSDNYRAGVDAEKKSEDARNAPSSSADSKSSDVASTSVASADKKSAEGKSTEGKKVEGTSATDKSAVSKNAESKNAKDARAESNAAPINSTASPTASNTASNTASTSESAAANSERSARRDSAAAENKRIEARATHHSRIGRGIGNIVKPSSAASRGETKGASQGKPAPKSTPSRATKPSKRK